MWPAMLRTPIREAKPMTTEIEMTKTDEALRVYRMNTEAFPKSANAQDSLGEALEIAGDKTAAREAYEHALKLDPKFPHAKDALGKLRP